MGVEHRWNDSDSKIEVLHRKPSPSSTLSTTNPTLNSWDLTRVSLVRDHRLLCKPWHNGFKRPDLYTTDSNGHSLYLNV